MESMQNGIVQYIISVSYSDANALSSASNYYSGNITTVISLSSSDTQTKISQISGLYASGIGATTWNSRYLTTTLSDSAFFVTINTNNTTITATHPDTANNYKGSTINISAIPVSV